MLKDGKIYQRINDGDASRMGDRKHRIKDLEDMPSREKMKPYDAWFEGGGASWKIACRWLDKHIGKVLRLSTIPKNYRKVIEEILAYSKKNIMREHDLLEYSDSYYVDPKTGILYKNSKKKRFPKYKRPLDPYLTYDGDTFYLKGNFWYKMINPRVHTDFWGHSWTTWEYRQVNGKLQKILDNGWSLLNS